jgi:hypothetical protein
MLTKTKTTKLSETTAKAQSSVPRSDAEIARRVLEIRSSWDLNERIARRAEADRRFNELLDALTSAHAA